MSKGVAGLRTAVSALALAAAVAAAAALTAARSAPLAAAAVSEQPVAGGFPLIEGGRPARVEADVTDWPGVLQAVQGLRGDLSKLSGGAQPAKEAPVVIVGTLGRSARIDALVAAGKLDVSALKGRWEGFIQQVVENPRPGVARALVIVGADKRGTIFGAYDLSERAGVSPWSWWADVPAPVRRDLSVAPGVNLQAPKVKYRGIFLNDENPALYGWANATFGGFNHAFYERVYELVLRLKGDYLWPAMWGKALYDDDPLNAVLADEMGVVIGTSHHEPMMRAHVEWERHGHGPWDYSKNPDALRRFWREGIERMGANESLVTVGMRGDGDEPMTQGTATQLLETIVADQRKIIGEVTGKPPAATPQVWALYKEVQDYYDAGMRVPDDVTLLFADDNWGNIRRLPPLSKKAPGETRPGGYGVYYHFDYVGGPRNYKWLNTNQIERTWEQMKRADDHGADRLWIVNVGDLKPMELPTEFFLDLAWNPDAMPVGKLSTYTRDWAAAQFGSEHAVEIAALLDGYTRLNARRKPELIDASTFSLTHDREAERVEAEWAGLERRADELRKALPKVQDDAFFQLVWFPIMASANHTRLYIAVGRNRLYAAQGRASAAAEADKARALFARDAELTRQFHEDLAGGKWRHMMSQTHIGYTGWQQPETNVPPELAATPAGEGFGVAVEGREAPVGEDGAVLPVLHRWGAQGRWIDVFARGSASPDFAVRTGAPWLKTALTSSGADTRVALSVDWARAPKGLIRVPVRIVGDGREVAVTAMVDNPARKPVRGAFVEAGQPLAIEAEHHAKATPAGGVAWTIIPNLGRTLSGVASYPATAPASEPGKGTVLDYLVDFERAGPVDLTVLVSPGLDVSGGTGPRFAISIDDAPPVVVNTIPDPSEKAWEKAVADNIRSMTTSLPVPSAGAHRVRLWRVDPGVVFQRLVISRGAAPRSYLGPPEGVRAR